VRVAMSAVTIYVRCSQNLFLLVTGDK
jgi:hypothetical protein